MVPEIGKYSDVSALLSSSQRAYLRSRRDSDIEEKSAHERSVRSRIRDRLAQSIEDLKLLQIRAESRDIRKAFQEPDLFNSVGGALGLIFNGVARASQHPSKEAIVDEESTAIFENFIEQGIRSFYLQAGKELQKVDVSIDVELGREIDGISGELAQLDQDELFLLYEGGQIGQQELISALDISREELHPMSGVTHNSDNN